MELEHILQNSIGAPAAWRVRINCYQKTAELIGAVFAPDGGKSQKETLFGSKAVDFVVQGILGIGC